MKKFLFIFLFLFSVISMRAQHVYYVQDTSDNANASDSNAGTDINYPWATWQHAFNEAMPGDTVYFRGSTWMMDTHIIHRPRDGSGHNGTYSAHICFFNYPGETPVLNFENYVVPYGMGAVAFEDPQYIELRGFIIENFIQQSEDQSLQGLEFEHYGTRADPPFAIAWISNVEVRKIGGAGIYVFGGDTVVFKNCDSHDNFDQETDPPGNHADGWTIMMGGLPRDTAKVLIMDGCRAWNNSDDGIEPGWGQQFYISNCWAWNNGYPIESDNDGIKPGPSWVVTDGKRIVRNCISAFNAAHNGNAGGFACLNLDDSYYGPRTIFSNVVSYNDGIGFSAGGQVWDAATGIGSYEMYNDIVYKNTSVYAVLLPWASKPEILERYAKDSCNTFVLQEAYPYSTDNPAYTVTDADFVSLDTAELRRPRKADGSLPDIDFMKLVSGSDLIDGGCTNAGLPYRGSAPDLGWYEYPSAEPNGLYANAGYNKIYADNDGSGSEMVILDGSESFDDGSITSYVWTDNGTQIATGVSPEVSISVGQHDIVLTVTDNDSHTATDAVNIWVQAQYDNQTPVAIIAGEEEQTIYYPAGADSFDVSFDGSASYDPDGTLIYNSWEWFDKRPGHWSIVGLKVNNITPTIRFPVCTEPDYKYEIYLRVVDNNQSTIRDTVYITAVQSEDATPPTANAGADQTVNDSDNSGAENITLNGSSSIAGSGNITSYVWTENSGQIATGATPTVSFAVGAHTVTLTVTNDSSLTDDDNVLITVTPFVEPGQGDSIIIDNDTELTDSLISPHRAAGDTIWINYNPAIHHDFSMSGNAQYSIVITSHPSRRAVMNAYQIISGSYLKFVNLNFNYDTYLMGNDIAFKHDTMRYEGLHLSAKNPIIDSSVFINCDTAIFMNGCEKPVIEHNIYNATNESIYNLIFPANDWTGQEFKIDNNIYNITPQTTFNGLPWGTWRATFIRYDTNSQFNIQE